MLLRSAELDSWTVENEEKGLLAAPRGRSLGLSSESRFFFGGVPAARRLLSAPCAALVLGPPSGAALCHARLVETALLSVCGVVPFGAV